MTSRFSAVVRAEAGPATAPLFLSLEADYLYYPEGPTRTAVRMERGQGGDAAALEIESDQLPHLRAGISSALRLVQAGCGAIAAAPPGDGPPAARSRRRRAPGGSRGRARDP